MELLSDAQLVALCQEGDVRAFNRLAARWESSLYAFVRRVLGDAEEARDVVQEALTKAYVNVKRLQDGAKFKSWVHHIALNLCRDRMRSPASRSEVHAFEEGGEHDREPAGTHPAAIAVADRPDQAAHVAGLAGVLGDVLGRLPEEQRTAILLREYQGFTSVEIGEMLGVSSATVRTRIFYGLKAVRRLLQERGFTEADLS